MPVAQHSLSSFPVHQAHFHLQPFRLGKLHHVFDTLTYDDRIIRLCDHIHRAELERLNLALPLLACRNDYDRNMGKYGILFHGFDQFEAVHF